MPTPATTTWNNTSILPRRWIVAMTFSALALAALALYLHDPATSRILPPCPFRWATGLLCPGCGSLRGLHQLLHSDPAAAFRLNPLMVLTLPLLAVAWLTTSAQKLPFAAAFRHRAWAWGALVTLLGYWISRNLV